MGGRVFDGDQTIDYVYFFSIMMVEINIDTKEYFIKQKIIKL